MPVGSRPQKSRGRNRRANMVAAGPMFQMTEIIPQLPSSYMIITNSLEPALNGRYSVMGTIGWRRYDVANVVLSKVGADWNLIKNGTALYKTAWSSFSPQRPGGGVLIAIGAAPLPVPTYAFVDPPVNPNIAP